MERCLEAKGWEVEVTFDNGISPANKTAGLPPEQFSRYRSDVDLCTSQLGYDVERKPTSEQLSRMYELEQSTWSCLTRLGYELPSLPSLTTYKETFGSDKAWDVVAILSRGMDEAEYKATFTECKPPLWYPVY